MSWEVFPEPRDAHERAVLIQAAERALVDAEPSAWWRSGFDDLGGDPASQEARSGASVVEP